MGKFNFSIIVFFIFPVTISCWIIFPDKCTPELLRIYQWPSDFASLHVPKYTVQIINEAWHAKGVFGVQIACPMFASTTLINPTIFRRIDSKTCVLKDGGIINPGEVITFEYSNILPFPLVVLSLKCS